MTPLPDILPHRAGVEPNADATAAVREVPTRRAVCLLLDAEDRPVQALAWANPRAAMKRRLAEPVEGEKTRRVNYGELVRSVLWRPVDSEFESDVVHAAVVRAAFPQRAAELLKFPQPWFVQVDPDSEFPRWQRVERPGSSGVSIGPLPDRSTAGRVIELLEDLFDLCRYYHILLDAPRGKACAYKDMGRCLAPCDGSMPMEQYRQRIAESAGVLFRPGALAAEIERQMQVAAGQLRFEAAKSLKARLEKARELEQADLAWAVAVGVHPDNGNVPEQQQRERDVPPTIPERPWAPGRTVGALRAGQLAIISAQPGPEADEVKLFHVDLGGVQEIGRFSRDTLNEAVEATQRHLAAQQVASEPGSITFDPLAFGPAMRHLFGNAKRRSRFCRVENLSASWLALRLDNWQKTGNCDDEPPHPTQAPE